MGYVTRQKGVNNNLTHCHDDDGEYEFHYITQGPCQFSNAGRTLRLKERSLVFSSPHMQHATQNARSSKHTSFFYVCFVIDPSLRRRMIGLQRAFGRIGFLHMGLEFGAQLEQLQIREQSPDRMLQASAQHLFLSLMYEIVRLANAPAKVEADQYTTRLVHHMHSIVGRQLDLDNAADRLGISKAHLIRVFKSNMGMPPLRYFNRMKMDTARDLLRRTDMTLAQIADQLSFCDQFYFSRVFKKYAGVSPDGYRRG